LNSFTNITKSNSSHQSLNSKDSTHKRYLNEINDDFNTSTPKAYNNQNEEEQNIYNMHYDSKNFIEFINVQRYNFFRRVETDYLNEPENDTLKLFKPDYYTYDPQSKIIVQQKLIDPKVTSSKARVSSKYK